ncbi:hypothetical protein FB45DRAFT_948185 [Roridomyces roridus]|uniref:Uncharacterized protein n=1 Tax=Roridomyces roridus TaxID=1738132 RepID=A0AAD7B1M9_9AGAR|nr:hypothetical protein FB45DRAFT_948185 [Roridomyces roridus]
MTNQTTLPHFIPLDPDEELFNIYQLLWPTDSESERLTPYLSSSRINIDVTHTWPNEPSPDNEERPSIAYIDLVQNPGLAVSKARYLGKLLVRQEYENFIADAFGRGTGHWRFFLTGQPGMGKSVGGLYILFRLLAMGQPVFFVESPTSVLYFSNSGVQNWVANAQVAVWTSSPTQQRMYHFKKEIKAETWVMQPWSTNEIGGYAELMALNRQDIVSNMELCGPNPRYLFAAQHISAESADEIINAAVQNNLVAFNLDGSDRMFIIQPLEEQNEQGNVEIQRTEFSIQFLSNSIITRTAELMGKISIGTQKQLAIALESPGKMRLPHVFGGGLIGCSLFLHGQADDFGIEPCEQDKLLTRPLYLQPQEPDFAAVNAIIITSSTLCLLQSTLSETHAHHLTALVQIIARIGNPLQVDTLNLVYCLVGFDRARVTQLVEQSRRAVNDLNDNPGDLSTVARARLAKLTVQGLVFDPRKDTLTRVVAKGKTAPRADKSADDDEEETKASGSKVKATETEEPGSDAEVAPATKRVTPGGKGKQRAVQDVGSTGARPNTNTRSRGKASEAKSKLRKRVSSEVEEEEGDEGDERYEPAAKKKTRKV